MDLVVTIAKDAWLSWLAEGDLPGEPATEEWALYYGRAGARRPPSPPRQTDPGARVYIIAHGFVRGYAPLLRVQKTTHGFALVRGGGAVACTVVEPGMRLGGWTPKEFPGFRGVRYRTWAREEEELFPDWMTSGLPAGDAARVTRLQALRANPANRMELKERAVAGHDPQTLFAGLQ